METFETIVKKSWGYNQRDYQSDYRWRLLKELYVLNFMYDMGRAYDTLPKKIHQIWLGGIVPDTYKTWMNSWKLFNSNWEYKLWTDTDVNDVLIPNRTLFNSIKNMGQKSDYLRYHILYQYGGLYVDTDFECLKSFDSLSYANFITGVGYPSKVELYIGLMASVSNHPILKRMLNAMDKANMKDIFNSTGTYLFTKVFFEEVKEYKKGILVLPTDYFYPFPNHKDHHLENGRDYIKECSYAVHHWAVSWCKHKKN